jgi:hypothetical protein
MLYRGEIFKNDEEELNALLGEVSIDSYKFQRDTIQTLSIKEILKIPFAISLGWK